MARMIGEHLWGIINAVLLKLDNGAGESINSRIQMAKTRARGFRNKERFRRAIYFYPGGLKLYPTGAGRQAYPHESIKSLLMNSGFPQYSNTIHII